MFARYTLLIAMASLVLASFGHVEGFVIPQVEHTAANRQSATTLSAHSSRRSFAVATMGATFAAALRTSVAPGFALEDLDMPSADSAEAQAVSPLVSIL